MAWILWAIGGLILWFNGWTIPGGIVLWYAFLRFMNWVYWELR